MIAWERVAAFGDEVEPDLDAQLRCMAALDIHLLELRSAWGRSVVDMSDAELHRVRAVLDAHGAGVSAIGSPVGKTPVDGPWETVETQLHRSLWAAEVLGTRRIRVFSFFVEPGEHPQRREAVIERMARMAAVAEAHQAVLVHENEKGIYGDTPERCLDILDTVGSPALSACFDVANFIQVGVTDVRAAWTLLESRVTHVHVKDAHRDGTVAPAGKGIGDWPFIVERLLATGYTGLLTLEPHLDGVVAGDGCARLGAAAAGLRGVLAGAAAGRA